MTTLRTALAPHGKKMVDALVKALDDEDGRVRIAAIKLGLAYLHGPPCEVPVGSGMPAAMMDPEEAVRLLDSNPTQGSA